MDGERNLTKKSLGKFAAAPGLMGLRAGFFETLVFFNQATATSDRNVFYGRILRAREKAGSRELHGGQFQLYPDWRHIAVRAKRRQHHHGR